MSFDVVVAADLDWGIGRDNALPWPRLPGDLAHFKRVTSATPVEGATNAIVMGSRTWESAEVKGRPLPRRVNVVISSRALAVPPGVEVAPSLDAALAIAAARATGTTFVVGGAAIYRLAFVHPACRRVYLTRVQGRFGCDTTIPDLDALGFRVVDVLVADARENDVGYRIEILRR